MKPDVSSRLAFSALIVAFLFHNIEEAIYICSYPVQSPVSFIHPANCTQFLWAVSILTFVGILGSVRALTTKKPIVFLFISTALAGILLFNVFLPHVIIAVYTVQYTPGLVSALVLNLPLSLVVLSKNRIQYLTKSQFLKHIFTGFIVGYLLFATIMLLVFLVIR